MPVRETPFFDGEYYHIYNRGVAKQEIYHRHGNYYRFELTLSYYLTTSQKLSLSRYLRLSESSRQEYNSSVSNLFQPTVSLIAYCLMPNHYHLLVRQNVESGITNYMRLVGNSYTRYFNTVNNRVGPLFQGQFKSMHIESNQYLLHISRYIHLNPLAASLIKTADLESYPYSSYRSYIKQQSKNPLIDPKIILDQFKTTEDYKVFCLDHFDYAQSISGYKSVLIDLE